MFFVLKWWAEKIAHPTWLSQQGYHIVCAENSKQALTILEDKPIDLLLSDVIMPEMNGYQLAAIVQKKYPSVKIQLASGYTDEYYEVMLDDTLHQSLLHKPRIIS